MVSFLPLNPCDEDSITNLLLQIDNAIQYGEDLDVREMKVTNSNSCSLILNNNNNNNFIYIALKSNNCPKRYLITK